MKLKSFTRSDTAISTVMSVVLILGLIVAVLSTYHVYYVPAWKTDAEHSHMDNAWEDMADLKSHMDILLAVLAVNNETTIPMSIPVTMGGGGIPVISPGKSSGTLSININDFGMKIKAMNGTTTVYDSESDSNKSLMNLGAISYSSGNNYYINQLFEYENGALMMVQQNKSLIKLSPGIILQRVNESNLSIVINAVKLISPGRCISSTAIEEIELSSNTSEELYSNQENISEVGITIYTAYPDAWEVYFNTSAKSGNLEYGLLNDYTLASDNTSVTLIVTGEANDNILLNVNRNIIDVSIGNM